MKVPFNWLKDYVDVNIDAKELGDKLTLTGSALEEVITQGDVIKNVVTGKIVEITQHPDADAANKDKFTNDVAMHIECWLRLECHCSCMSRDVIEQWKYIGLVISDFSEFTLI